ncbi:DUF5060 domain-containing protein [Telluribacter sp.]|jgi:hypothetical protein|uniref:DUF5060 domain-containing protein n=1 Tax=Telluribacter sp. TaxID=1978767 RepID=UPI002E0DDCF9|nr:DUF5060 domain-containing protein [Telluribacter sp.]
MYKILLLILLATAGLTGFNQSLSATPTEQWGVYELVLQGPSSGNPFMEVDLEAVFKNGKESVKVPGFYDGAGTYRVRFSPHRQGKWTYLTTSNAPGLSGKKGDFRCVAPTGKNHGPVKIVNTYYLQYADGTPYYAVGTTAYQWTSVKQSIQDKTIETLAGAPFNKIRMCVFPKYYQYGNKTEPWAYPFKREGTTNDFTQPHYEFFRNFEKRVQQLAEMGIQADVILFHPYDVWGYASMGAAMNERYVRTMIARLSAYRNVWWSLANEWDEPKIKQAIDWEAIGTLLQKEDPHQRLRGIHNWYDSEDHFYDHTRPWVTHLSTQTAQFYNAIKWRNKYRKPLLFDEMRYEGDVKSGWGNMKGKDMASYFWMAGLSGGYGTHGDTFSNQADEGNEVRWWAKGGQLVGESPERIRYFRTVMEQAPIQEMTPEFRDNGDPKNFNTNQFLLSKPGAYYLAYTAGTDQTIEINLTGTKNYKMDVIDTWNMQVTEQATIKPGLFKFHTTTPYTALRIYAN